MINGNNIFISLDGSTPIAATRTNEIQSECEKIEVSSPTSGQWRKYLAGRKAWSFTGNILVANTGDVTALLNVGTEYTIYVCGRDASGNVTVCLQGRALCTQARVFATRGSLAYGDFSFTGNGELEEPQSTQ